MLISLPLLFAFFGALRVIASEATISIVLNAAQFGPEATVLPQWLWVHNLFQPDSGLAGILPTAQEFASFLQMNTSYISPQTLVLLSQHGLITFGDTAMTVNTAAYEALTSGIVAANNLTGLSNGWFGLPLIAGVSLFFQQKLMNKNNTSTQQQPGGKMMLYFFPLFSVYICATSNAAFSIYWVASNVYSLALGLAIDAVYKRREKNKVITPQDLR